MQDRPDSFVVVFFRTNAGELRCRVTAVVTRETWIVEHASDLRQLLVERHAQLREGGGPTS
jgi:hypothetical protein